MSPDIISTAREAKGSIWPARPFSFARNVDGDFPLGVNATPGELKRGRRDGGLGNGVARRARAGVGVNEREKVRLIKGRLNDGVCPPHVHSYSSSLLRTPFAGGVWPELTRKVRVDF